MASRDELTKKMTAEAALRHIVRQCARDFDQALTRVKATDDPEGPHGARVALRRLRTVLWGFRPILDRGATDPTNDQARALFRLLGRLRDADVLAQHMADSAEAGPLRAQAARVRAEVRDALRDHGADRFAAGLCDQFDRTDWRRKGRKARHWCKGPVKALAADALDRAFLRCAGHGKDIAAMPDADRHEFRKDLKSLRYLCDYFSPLWKGGASRRFTRDLRDLQDALGVLTDVAMARGHGGLATEARAALEARAAAALDAAAKDWRHMRKAKAWWH